MAIRVEAGRVVVLAYRMSDQNGRLLEERTPEEPFEYIQGSGAIVAPVERAIEGKTPGYQAEILVTPREGYGEYHSGLVTDVSRAALPPGIAVAVGMKFNTTDTEGKPMTVRVIEVDDKNVTIDGNHPLAGLELIFELRVLDVREAEEEDSPFEPVSMRPGEHERERDRGGERETSEPKVITVTKRTRDDVH